MTWTPLQSATLLGTLVLVRANVNLESFRNNGFIPLNGAGSGTPGVGSGIGLNQAQGNFGGIGTGFGGASENGVNRIGDVNLESFRNSGFLPLNGAGSGTSGVGFGTGLNGVQGNFGGIGAGLGGAAESGVNRQGGVNLESFRNSGFFPFNGAGSGTSGIGSGTGLNGAQGNFGSIRTGFGGAAESGVNRHGGVGQGGYNYPAPANPLTLGGSAALGVPLASTGPGPIGVPLSNTSPQQGGGSGYNYNPPANPLLHGQAALGPAGFPAPSTAPQTPSIEYGAPRGGQAALGDRRGVAPGPVAPATSGTLASTISQILQQLTGGQVSEVVGPTSRRGNLPVGNVNFFTASDPSEGIRPRGPAPIAPVNNFRFLQPRTETSAFIAIAPGQIPSAASRQSALGGANFRNLEQSALGGSNFNNLEQPAPGEIPSAASRQSALEGSNNFRNLEQSAFGGSNFNNLEQPAPGLPEPQPLTFTPIPVPADPVPTTAPVETAPVAPAPVKPAPVTSPAVTPLVSGGVPLEAVDLGSGSTGINSLPTFGILLGSAPVSPTFQTVGLLDSTSQNQNAIGRFGFAPSALNSQLFNVDPSAQGTFGSLQGFNNLPIVDIANLGLAGQQFGGQFGGTQGIQLTPGFSQSFGNDLNTFGNIQGGLQNNLLIGQGGFGVDQSLQTGTGVGGAITDQSLLFGQGGVGLDQSLQTRTGAGGGGAIQNLLIGQGGVGLGQSVQTSAGAGGGGAGGVGAGGFGAGGVGSGGVGAGVGAGGIGAGGVGAGGVGAGGFGAGGFGSGGVGAGAGAGGIGAGGVGAGGVGAGGVGAGGFGADQSTIGSGVTLQIEQGKVGTGLGAGSGFGDGVPLTPVAISGVDANQGGSGAGQSQGLSNLVVGLSNSISTQGIGSGVQGNTGSSAAEPASAAISAQAAETTGASEFGRRTQLQTSRRVTGIPISLTGPQVPGAVAASSGSQANNAIESNVIGRRKLQTETQSQVTGVSTRTGVSLSSAGPQVANKTPAAPAA